MKKLFTLNDYIEIKGVTVIATQLSVDHSTVSSWKALKSSPTPFNAAKLIKATNGLLTWEGIYQPYVDHNCDEQLSFEGM